MSPVEACADLSEPAARVVALATLPIPRGVAAGFFALAFVATFSAGVSGQNIFAATAPKPRTATTQSIAGDFIAFLTEARFMNSTPTSTRQTHCAQTARRFSLCAL